MDSSRVSVVENEKLAANAVKAEYKMMIENFVYQRNDKGAALFSKLKSYISNCSYKHRHVALSAEDQEDITQEIAFKVLKSYTQIHDNHYGWLFKVAHNEYIERLRKVIPKNNLIEVYSGNELITVSDRFHGDVSCIDSIDFLDCFDEVFERATTVESRDEDKLIYGKYAEGFTHDEIAMQLNKVTSFIAKRISALNQAIRELLVKIC